MVEISPAFAKAQEESKKLLKKPTNEDLLELYALFKIGNGEDWDKRKKASVFNLKDKYKEAAWRKVLDEDKPPTPEQAQERYVAKVEELKEDLGWDVNKQPEAVGAS
ncbi:acyl-CoA-binding protein [Hypoxylon rubiginosum]|uniref:Acyl-CoA-binding protein n=1 Tax=Hypoxylon rubiginosum TaxID=110542 RepID=A0ACC0D0A6_9PEZI|nr:acyl-CoA-binding protein [Hypoxylon rubiginosum]